MKEGLPKNDDVSVLEKKIATPEPTLEKGLKEDLQQFASPEETRAESAMTDNEKVRTQALSLLDETEKKVKKEMTIRQKIADSFGQVVLGTSSVGNFFEMAKDRIKTWTMENTTKPYKIDIADLEKVLEEAKEDKFLGLMATVEGEDKKFHLAYNSEKTAPLTVEKTGLTN